MRAAGFISTHDLWTPAQQQAAEVMREALAQQGIETVRVSFPDQHGLLRGKTFTTKGFDSVLRDGCRVTSTLLLKDTSHRTAFPIWKDGANSFGLLGAGDVVLVPDPSTWRLIPWASRSAWVLSDVYYQDGTAVPFATRHLLRRALDSLAADGHIYVCGIELEFSVYRLIDPRLGHEHCGQPATPPAVRPVAHGFQLLTESRYDEVEGLLERLREVLIASGIPLRSLEIELGPGQIELTLEPVKGIDGADQAVLTRSVIKQVCRRMGYHATFMARPAFPNACASGWHLHQSLMDTRTGDNAFASELPGELLSEMGRRFAAGLLAHARAACLFVAPTINGYKRYRPFTMAPDRIVWGRDNRGAMLRVVGTPADPATHLENRAGEPAANPYLYLASQVVCGLDGMRSKAELPAEVTDPYDDSWPRLPRNMLDAMAALRESRLFQEAFGEAFIDYYIGIKQFELDRFLHQDVTDWEQREYFENF